MGMNNINQLLNDDDEDLDQITSKMQNMYQEPGQLQAPAAQNGASGQKPLTAAEKKEIAKRRMRASTMGVAQNRYQKYDHLFTGMTERNRDQIINKLELRGIDLDVWFKDKTREQVDAELKKMDQ